MEPDPSHTLEERVVHWYFAQLDNNGSQDINKKELKPFKKYLKKKAKPKKCARRFTDYCDLNKDRAISLQELKGCLGVTKEGKRERRWEKKNRESKWLRMMWQQGHVAFRADLQLFYSFELWLILSDCYIVEKQLWFHNLKNVKSVTVSQ